MARSTAPHSHSQRGTDKYTETFTITEPHSTALLPLLWLPSDWIHPLWHIQSAQAAVGRLADWQCDYLHGACSLRTILFIKKKKTNRYKLAHRHACRQAWLHTHTQVVYDMTGTFDQQSGLSMVSVVGPLFICLVCFIHSRYKMPWYMKTLKNNEHRYQTLMTPLVVPGQITYCLSIIFTSKYAVQFKTVWHWLLLHALLGAQRHLRSLHVVKDLHMNEY